MSHSSSLKARRKRQKTKRLIDGAAKRARRLERLASAPPRVKKEKVKREKPKKEKVEAGDAKKAKRSKEPVPAQGAKKGKAGAGEPAS